MLEKIDLSKKMKKPDTKKRFRHFRSGLGNCREPARVPKFR